jgi:hypothetical protein
MLKNISRLESIVEGKVGHFTCDMDTPIALVKEMLFQFQKYIGQVEDHVKQLQEKSVSEQEKVDEPKIEEINQA